MRHRVNFRAERSNRCIDMVIFRLFKIAAVAILDLFYACLDHPRSVVGGLYRCARFG